MATRRLETLKKKRDLAKIKKSRNTYLSRVSRRNPPKHNSNQKTDGISTGWTMNWDLLDERGER